MSAWKTMEAVGMMKQLISRHVRYEQKCGDTHLIIYKYIMLFVLMYLFFANN